MAGDIGAMLCTCWALKQVDSVTNRILMKNVKARDFEPCELFEIQGRPYIDEQQTFEMVKEPGLTVEAQAPKKPPKSEIDPNARAGKVLRDEGKTHEEIADKMGVSLRTVQRWQKNYWNPGLNQPNPPSPSVGS